MQVSGGADSVLKCEKIGQMAKKKVVLCEYLFKSLIFAHYKRAFYALT